MTPQVQKISTIGLGYLLDDRYLLHNPGIEHPESPQRLVAIKQALEDHSLSKHWIRLQPRMASIDASVSTESVHTSLLAAGGLLECVDSICSGQLQRIFAFVRPPGHHAERKNAKGFCLFNNIALAAAYARRRYKLERLAIVDFDVHHGNGTQSCFYGSPNVLYISSHQFPFYPGSGDFSEVGVGNGKGYTLNFPLPEGTDDSDFISIFSKIVSVVLDQFAPQLVLVSAGFDGHYGDPLGGLSFTHSGYASAAATLIRAAERWCEGKICFVLEGGYNLQALKECCRAVMSAMERRLPHERRACEGSVFYQVLKKVSHFTGDLWKL
jgi:acetoin utilization deacetylase AcuC-like enzyme